MTPFSLTRTWARTLPLPPELRLLEHSSCEAKRISAQELCLRYACNLLQAISIPLQHLNTTHYNMADALKAEGNKLFAEKKFEESMYAPHQTQCRRNNMDMD
jgi:hypothetical protein